VKKSPSFIAYPPIRSRWRPIRIRQEDLAHDMGQIVDVEIASHVAPADAPPEDVAHQIPQHAASPIQDVAVVRQREARVLAQEPAQDLPIPCEVERGLQHEPHGMSRPGRVACRLGQKNLVPLREDAIHHSLEEPFLVPEVAIEERPGCVGGEGDVRHRRLREALGSEDGLGGIQDRASLLTASDSAFRAAMRPLDAALTHPELVYSLASTCLISGGE
jgi:hypothetical protein